MSLKLGDIFSILWLAILFALIFLYSPFSSATEKPKEPTPTATAEADAIAGAVAVANANASSKSSSESSSNSNSDAAANNSLTVNEARQAPGIAQGSLYLVGCGFSANAGGSQTGGAAFLGLQFITPYCRDQAQIANEAAFGNVKTACEMNRLTPAGQRNLKRLRAAGLEPEPCPGAQAAQPPASQPPVVVVTGEVCESRERADRVFEKCMAK